MLYANPIKEIVHITVRATLDFPSGTSDDLAVDVPGATDGDIVLVGAPNAAMTATASFRAWVSAPDVVTIRCIREVANDPPEAEFRVTVLHYDGLAPLAAAVYVKPGGGEGM